MLSFVTGLMGLGLAILDLLGSNNIPLGQFSICRRVFTDISMLIVYA